MLNVSRSIPTVGSIFSGPNHYCSPVEPRDLLDHLANLVRRSSTGNAFRRVIAEVTTAFPLPAPAPVQGLYSPFPGPIKALVS